MAVPGPGADYVNPYHQAWQCQATHQARPDTRKLAELLEEQEEEPVIGLEKVVEWWPGETGQAPVYTCQLCDGWLGWAEEAVRHVTGESHRRKQLLTRYPALEEMIKDMEASELLERAKEEERKYGRRYEVIQVVVDIESYEEFYEKLEHKPFRRRQSVQPISARGQFPRHPAGPPGFSQPPPPRGHVVPPPFCRPPPLNVPPPLAALPPVNVPPPMNFPPPRPPFKQQPQPRPDNREHCPPGRGRRGQFTLPRGGGPSTRGGFCGGRGSHHQQFNQREHYSDRGTFSSHKETYESSQPKPRENFQPGRDNSRGGEYYGNQSTYSCEAPEHFVRRENRNDYYYEDEHQRSRQSLDRREAKQYNESHEYNRGRQSQRSSERNPRKAEEERSLQKSSQRPSHSRRRPDRDRRPRRRRREEEEDEDLPEACYAISADQEELDTENNSKRKRNGLDNDRNRSYDDYYAQYHEKSRRSITRFYESKQEKRKKPRLAPADDKPYEGPTIFDKVFRTKRKGEDGGGGERSEKQIDREMEAEWRRYKEQSEQRIRRERQKLQKYEKKLQEIHGDEQSKKNTKNPSNSPERMSSPPRAYGGRAAYSSSESDREPSPASKSEGEADRCQTKFDPY